MKTNFKNFLKQQVARFLALTMTCSSLLSSGTMLGTAYAAPVDTTTLNPIYGDVFAEKVIALANSNTYADMDSKALVRQALIDLFGTTRVQFNTNTDKSGVPVLPDVDDDSSYFDILDESSYPSDIKTRYDAKDGTRQAFIVGKGNVMRFTLNAYNDGTAMRPDCADIPYNGNNYSSLFAKNQKDYGRIFIYNQGMSVAVGEYTDVNDLKQDFAIQDSDVQLNIVDDDGARILGATLPDPGDKFGNTWFVTMDNVSGKGLITNTAYLGDTTKGGKQGDQLTDMEAVYMWGAWQPPATHDVTVTVKNSLTGADYTNGKVTFYNDVNLTDPYGSVDITTGSMTLPRGAFWDYDANVKYAQVTDLPLGYTSDGFKDVHPTAKKVDLTVSPASVYVTADVRDSKDNTVLKGSVLRIKEYSNTDGDFTDIAEMRYDDAQGTYVINGSYTNREGMTFDDGKLYFYPENGGQYQIYQESVQSGYTADDGTTPFAIDVSTASGTLNAKTFKNTAQFVLKIKAETEEADGTRANLANAKFSFIHNLTNYELITDSNGEAQTIPFADSGANSISLVQETTKTGYTIPPELLNGKTIPLVKDTNLDLDKNAFVISLTGDNSVVNPVYVPPVYDETIVLTAKDNYNNPVVGAKYNVYKNNVIINDTDDTPLVLTTDANGKVTLSNAQPGVYKFELVEQVPGYGYQPDVNGLSYEAKGDTPSIQHSISDNGFVKQAVVLEIENVDNNGAPIVGAVYSITLSSSATDAKNNEPIPADTLVGYFQTNNSGKIVVDKFGSAAIYAGGINYSDVNVATDNATDITGNLLVNGTYQIKEEYIPSEYVPNNTNQAIDATWEPNEDIQDQIVNGKLVAPYGKQLTAKTTLKNDIDVLTIDVYVKDINKSPYQYYEDSTRFETYYNDTEINAASGTEANDCARLVGNIEVQLTTEIDILDSNGQTIPANTVIGRYVMPKDGHVVISTMTENGFNGEVLPASGIYRIELSSKQGVGYTYSDDSYLVMASDKVNGKIVREFTGNMVISDIDIVKTDFESDKPISGITFDVYSSAVLKSYGVPDLTDRDAIETAIASNGINPIQSNTTDVDGIACFNGLPYGKYVLLEKKDSFSAKYEIADPIGLDSTGANFELPVTNVNTEFNVVIKNVDADDNTLLINGTKFTVNDDALNVYEINVANGIGRHDNNFGLGEYTITQDAFADGYLLNNEVITLTAQSSTAITAMRGVEPLTVDTIYNPAVQMKEVIITVPNTKNSLNVTLSNNGQDLIGAEMSVVNNDGTVVATWTTQDETDKDAQGLSVHIIRGLTPGVYQIITKAPDGFATPAAVDVTMDNITPVVSANVEANLTIVTVKTVDGVTNNPIKGVIVELRDADDNTVATFDDDHLTQTGIPVGDYTLVQTTTPVGYQKPTAPIAVTVEDTDAEQVFINNELEADGRTPKDNRTYGTLSILKKDTVDNKPLQGVEFELRYKEDVTIDGQTYRVDDVVETLVTDAEGKASLTTPVLAGTYDVDGTFTAIKYMLVETKAASGQYEVDAIDEIVFQYVDDTTPLITMPELLINNNRPNIVITQSSNPESKLVDSNGEAIVGNEHLTAVQNGDEITYTIYVTNNGTAQAHSVFVKDILPKQVEFVSADNNGTLDKSTNAVCWTIDSVAVGETVELKCKVKIQATGAVFVENQAGTHVPDKIPSPNDIFDFNDPAIKWDYAPKSIHQVVSFTSWGDEGEIVVPYQTEIQFNYNTEALSYLKDFKIIDIIPEGLTYVPDSAKINGKAVDNETYDEKTRTLTIPGPDEANWVNEMEFSFTAMSDYVPMNGTTRAVNKATMSYIANEYTQEPMVISTQSVTVRVEAMLEPELTVDVPTYVGPVNKADNITVLQKDDEVKYTVTLKNPGEVLTRNAMVFVDLPIGMSIVEGSQTASVDKNILITSNDSGAQWFVGEVPAKSNVTLSFKAKVDTDKAVLFDTSAKVDITEKLATISEDKTYVTYPDFTDAAVTTDHALYQTLTFKKTAEIEGKPVGTVDVVSGDTVIYTMCVETAADVNGVVVTDTLPDGLTYVKDSAQMKMPGSDKWIDMDDAEVYTGSTRTISFARGIDKNDIVLTSGTAYFRFKATVDSLNANSPSEFVNSAKLAYRKNATDNVQTVISSKVVLHMSEISISGSKVGGLDTYHGDYAERNHVTVVQKDDVLKFDISVKNNGASTLKNVVIRDTVPENSGLVTEGTVEYTEKDGVLTWIIPELKANETKTVSFSVKVTGAANTAYEIVNTAKYAVPADVNDIKDDEWTETNAVVYQVVAITMSSSASGGTNESDAKKVDIGSTFTYNINVECVDDIYGLKLTDKIPEGLTLVDNSVKVVVNGGEPSAAKYTYDENNRTLTFDEFTEVKAGKMVLSFDVKVNDIEEYDKTVVFTNKVDAELKPSENANNTLKIASDPITHKAVKTNATDTPKLGFETTSATLVWSFITLVAVIGIGVFGYIGFIQPYIKRKDD